MSAKKKRLDYVQVKRAPYNPAPALSNMFVAAQQAHTSAAAGLGALLDARQKLAIYFSSHPSMRTIDRAIKEARVATAQIAELTNTTEMLARPRRKR